MKSKLKQTQIRKYGKLNKVKRQINCQYTKGVEGNAEYQPFTGKSYLQPYSEI